MTTATSSAMAMIATHSMALRTGPLCLRCARLGGAGDGAGSGTRGASSTALVGRPEKKGSLTVDLRLLVPVAGQDAPRCLIDRPSCSLNQPGVGTEPEQEP